MFFEEINSESNSKNIASRKKGVIIRQIIETTVPSSEVRLLATGGMERTFAKMLPLILSGT